MEMMVNLKDNSYPIYIEKGCLDSVETKISRIYSGKKIIIITDDNVNKHYGNKVKQLLSNNYDVNIIEVMHGEASKNFQILPSLYQQLLDNHITRSDLIIALGGGVIGDLAGFVAATYLRGVKFVQIPTSLLAQVDSSVGGKVAVDLPSGKNLVGAFYHPKMVLIDPLVLKTLDQRYINDGMGEVIKYGCIKDAKLFKKLANYSGFDELYEDIDDIIYTCVNIKRIVVENDEKDFGDRLVLNFGHTLAHTIEQYFNFDKYSHGEAVSIGMYQITKLSEMLGITKEHISFQLAEVLTKYGLPIKCDVEMNQLMDTINHDKKNINSKLSLILLETMGKAIIYPTQSSFFNKIERV